MDANVTKKQKKTIKKQISKIADLETEEDFFKALSLATKEWKQFAPNFTKYFKKTYIDGWRRNWAQCFAP